MAAQAEMGHPLPERRAGMPFGLSTSFSLDHPSTEKAVWLIHCVLCALTLLDMQSPGHRTHLCPHRPSRPHSLTDSLTRQGAHGAWNLVLVVSGPGA